MKPFLVVAPLSTIANWRRELEKWLPDSYIVTLQGNKVSRDIIKSHEFYYGVPVPKKITKFNVLLTTYEMLSIEIQSLNNIHWRTIVIDEGQKLKNQKSKIFTNAVKLKSDFRILLSGTPLQNNIDELLNLLHFISPDKFNASVNEELKQKFYASIKDNVNENYHEENKNGGNEDHVMSSNDEHELDQCTKLAETSKNPSNEAAKSIKELLQPHLLRRLKENVLENFPLKKEIIVPIDLTRRQRKIYKCIFKKNFEYLSLLDKQSKTKRPISLRAANNILLYLRF